MRRVRFGSFPERLRAPRRCSSTSWKDKRDRRSPLLQIHSYRCNDIAVDRKFTDLIGVDHRGGRRVFIDRLDQSVRWIRGPRARGTDGVASVHRAVPGVQLALDPRFAATRSAWIGRRTRASAGYARQSEPLHSAPEKPPMRPRSCPSGCVIAANVPYARASRLASVPDVGWWSRSMPRSHCAASSPQNGFRDKDGLGAALLEPEPTGRRLRVPRRDQVQRRTSWRSSQNGGHSL